MPRRTLVELVHLAASLMVTALLVRLASWAYPLGRETIEAVGWFAAGAVLVMGIDPLRRAWAADRGEPV